MRKTLMLGLVIAAMAALTGPAGARPAPAAAGTAVAAATSIDAGAGLRELERVGPDLNGGKPLPLAPGARELARQAVAARGDAARAAATPAQVGEHKLWLAFDHATGQLNLKDFVLRAVGQHIEVWTASNLAFPAGDCRNDERVQIGDEQIQYLIGEFDGNIHPVESAALSVPVPRGGTKATLPGIVGLPPDYYVGDADKVVTLVDNIRDRNYYDLDNAGNLPYVGGFFYSFYNLLLDRKVMTVDAYDWAHRTGASPPNEPVPGDSCASKPARPFLYEGVFAHEYQHLLQFDQDLNEAPWVDEGLADWAAVRTGYFAPARPVDQLGFDNHVQCILGNLATQTPANPQPQPGGPENSLTVWEDQGPDEVLCDYGAVSSFMLYLDGRFGARFITALHREPANGLDGVQAVLDRLAPGVTASRVLHDWLATLALDRLLDRGALLLGGSRWRYRAPALDAAIEWANPDAYSSPGAPANGADFVRLTGADGRPLRGSRIRSIAFDGASTIPPLPVEWTVDPDPPGRQGDPALYSGTGSNLDRAVVHEVTVPAGNSTLELEASWSTEHGFDYAFVQVSTDGGATYQSLANADTIAEADPIAPETVHENLPGFAGDSGGWRHETFDLTPYAGRTVLLAFRYASDSGNDLPGFWVDDVRVGGVPVTDGTSLDGWRSETQARPVPVRGFTVQIVAYRTGGHLAAITRLKLDARFRGRLDGLRLRLLLAFQPDVVAAIVTHDEPTERHRPAVPYTLTVNGVRQPGG